MIRNLVLLLALTAAAHARLNETVEEVVKRYGYPDSQKEIATILKSIDGSGTLKYLKLPIKVVMRFHARKVAYIEYFKGSPLSQDELIQLLEKNRASHWMELISQESELTRVRKAVEDIRDLMVFGKKPSDPNYTPPQPRYFICESIVASYFSDLGNLMVWDSNLSKFLFQSPIGVEEPANTLKGL